MSQYDRRWARYLLILGALLTLLIYVTRIASASDVHQVSGMLSQYNYWPWYATIKWRQGPNIPETINLPPDHIIEQYDGTLAISDCSQIGSHGWMWVYNGDTLIEKLSVIVIDCAGMDALVAPGESWMDRDNYAAEMGWNLRQAHPDWYRNRNVTAVIKVWPKY